MVDLDLSAWVELFAVLALVFVLMSFAFYLFAVFSFCFPYWFPLSTSTAHGIFNEVNHFFVHVRSTPF